MTQHSTETYWFRITGDVPEIRFEFRARPQHVYKYESRSNADVICSIWSLRQVIPEQFGAQHQFKIELVCDASVKMSDDLLKNRVYYAAKDGMAIAMYTFLNGKSQEELESVLNEVNVERFRCLWCVAAFLCFFSKQWRWRAQFRLAFLSLFSLTLCFRCANNNKILLFLLTCGVLKIRRVEMLQIKRLDLKSEGF